MAVSTQLRATSALRPIIRIRFPIREYGMNYASQPLQEHEIEEMKASEEVIERILRSYRLMLSFYGKGQANSPSMI
jgi:Opioid growth factor receptor (OGFr) conserved region